MRYKELTLARRMRKMHRPMPVIVDFFGGRYTAAEIETALTGLRDRERARGRVRYARAINIETLPTLPPAVAVSPAAMIEREHRLSLWPASLTAAICGDPPVGYSALDRRAQKNA